MSGPVRTANELTRQSRAHRLHIRASHRKPCYPPHWAWLVLTGGKSRALTVQLWSQRSRNAVLRLFSYLLGPRVRGFCRRWRDQKGETRISGGSRVLRDCIADHSPRCAAERRLPPAQDRCEQVQVFTPLS
jgi:hypothetical protein